MAATMRVIALAFTVGLICACAGRAANPVMVYQHDDGAMSCDALERELQLIEEQVLSLMPKTVKANKNTTLGVAGIFLIVPFFFMDLSKAEQIEVNALTKRYNHLFQISNEKHCGLNRQPIPEFKRTEY